MIDVKRDYLTGMNLFHLPRRFRRFFLTKVLTLRSLETEADDETKITFSYEEMLNEKYLSAVAKTCVRKYVIRRMGAVSLQLHPNLWEDFFLGPTSKLLDRAWRYTSASTAYKKSYEDLKLPISYLSGSPNRIPTRVRARHSRFSAPDID